MNGSTSGRRRLRAVGGTPAGALDALIAETDTTARYVLPAGADAIAVEELVKTYADGTTAVRGITLRVAPGQAYGLLGPNGAGKSTTIGVLGTLVRPTAGHALVGGFDVADDPMEVRRRIGFA